MKPLANSIGQVTKSTPRSSLSAACATRQSDIIQVGLSLFQWIMWIGWNIWLQERSFTSLATPLPHQSGRPAVSSLGFGQSGCTSSPCGSSAAANMNLPTSRLCNPPPHHRTCALAARMHLWRLIVSKRNVSLGKTGKIPCVYSGLSQAWHCHI